MVGLGEVSDQFPFSQRAFEISVAYEIPILKSSAEGQTHTDWLITCGTLYRYFLHM